jgi:hypothetical protein
MLFRLVVWITIVNRSSFCALIMIKVLIRIEEVLSFASICRDIMHFITFKKQKS